MASTIATSIGLDLSKNLSFFTVPAAFLCTLGPHIYSVASAGKAYDNMNPRSFKDNLAKDATINEARKQRLARAEMASENGFETVAFYAAAVVAANQTGVDTQTLNAVTLGYVASRAAFNAVYVHGCRSLSWVRSLLWHTGVGLTLTLWVEAGLKTVGGSIFREG